MKISDHINPPSHLNVYAGSKDTQSIFTSANKNYLTLVGCKKSLVGLSDFETPCATAEHAQEFYDQDRLVEKQKNQLFA
jgi:hypothetical protein